MKDTYNLSSILKIAMQTPLFSALSFKESEELLSYLEVINYKKDDIIFYQDGSPKSIYIIIEGEIELKRKKENSEFIIKRFLPKECFGETDLIGILPYFATAMALKNCTLLEFSKISLHKLSKNNLALFNKFLFNLSREICRNLHDSDLLLTDILYENEKLKNNH